MPLTTSGPNNWAHETMIWNQWAGSQSFWPGQANGPGGFALNLDGVPYHFFANGSELMFFRDTQVASGSVDILAAYKWEVAHGFAKASDIPTQIEYGTEVAYTSGTETFNMTDFGVNMVPHGGTTTTTTSTEPVPAPSHGRRHRPRATGWRAPMAVSSITGWRRSRVPPARSGSNAPSWV